jgi:ribonuclease HII
MHRAIDKLLCIPQYLIIDGNRFNKYGDTPYACIVEGDAKYFSIAAASILAKTYRDDYMKQIAVRTPRIRLAQQQGLSNHQTPQNCFGTWPYAISS